MMWTILLVGACITISFMFKVGNKWFHSLMTGMLAGFIALMLFLIQSLDIVFIGDICVTNDHFLEISHFLDVVDQEPK